MSHFLLDTLPNNPVTLLNTAFENILGKEDSPNYQHFLLVPQCFQSFSRHISSFECYLNSLPNNKILKVTKLKAFVDNKLNVAKMMISPLDRVENTERKR